MSNTRIYRIFHGIRQRCNNEKSKVYKWYGGRGITVCEEWNNADGFINFYKWSINNGYADNLSIDRIDVNKGYSPDNCRWVSTHEQARNRRNNIYVNYNGKKEVLFDVAQKENINNTTLQYRYKKNEDLDLSRPIHRTVLYNGNKLTLRELSKITGIPYNTLQTRYTMGYSDDEMVSGYMSKIRKKVVQLTKDGKTIAIYDGLRVASIKTGIRYSGIAMTCSGKRKSCGGYVWKFFEDS